MGDSSSDIARRLSDSKLGKAGLLCSETIAAAAELIRRVTDSELETVRVLFTDQHGVLRGKTIVAGAIESIFTSGIAAPSTLLLKDTSHRTVFPVWSPDAQLDNYCMAGAGDILMVPDPATFRILPWSPHSSWILCDVRLTNLNAIEFSTRDVLKDAIARLADKNRKLVTGLEVEFHVFEVIDPALEHAQSRMPGSPVTTRNLAQGYQFLTETRYAQLEPVMDDLRRNCEGLDIPVRSMEVEMGPSQFEFTFDPADPLSHADNMMMFRTMVKEVCFKRGLHATFMCQPKIDNVAASGWHLHQSVTDSQTGSNLMMPAADGELTETASAWIAGLLEHAAATCMLTTPTVNGYKRYRAHQLAPDRIQWGRDNRGAMIRALLNNGDSASRIENRVAEPTANPYMFFASQILCGLDGLNRNLTAPMAVETPYDSASLILPDSLLRAIDAFEASSFYRTALGDNCVDYFVQIKRAEWKRYHQTVSEWEQAEYFGVY